MSAPSTICGCGLTIAGCPCGFCHGGPVGDAATYLDGKERPPAPCPRCGETYVEEEPDPAYLRAQAVWDERGWGGL